MAAHLTRVFDCPVEHSYDLARIAEYVVLTHGVGPLYDELHALFGGNGEPDALQRALAQVAGLVRERGWGAPADRDDLVRPALERALRRRARSSTSSRTSPWAGTTESSCT